VALGLLLAGGAAAHWPAPEEVVAAIRGPVGREVGVVEVARDARVARLLVVRVGGTWYDLAPARRRALAEGWLDQWREALPEGLVGVVDAASGRPVVNYDARGAARLPSPPTLP
jgi:hypothetical protein